MSELYFSDGPSGDDHLAKSDDIEVAFVNGKTTRLHIGRLARILTEDPVLEVVRLPDGTDLASAKDLRNGPNYKDILKFERDLEPIPDMYYEAEQLRTASQISALVYLENVQNSGLEGDKIYLQHYQERMMSRQHQEALTYCRLFDTIQDDGHELWLRLEAGPSADPALRSKVIMARFALLEAEYQAGMVNLVPKIQDEDTWQLLILPEQLILAKQWLYTET